MGDSADLNYDEEVHRVLEQARKLQEDAALAIAAIASMEEPLRQRAASLDSHIRRLCGSIRSRKFDSKQAEKWEEELSRARGSLIDGDAATYLPSKSPGRLLRMFLGPINVRANKKDVQLKVKEEYNSFRDRTAFLFLVFPLLLLGLDFWVWNGCLPALPVQLYQAWLLFLYTCLALRENILRVNGSDIRPCLSPGSHGNSLSTFGWVYHHYFAMAMALISLTWEIERGPNCSQKQRGVQLFLGWATMQGFAMLLQNRYQRQRLYTRIALGKARRMDVVWGETAGVNGQLLLLFPILFLMQGFEAYVGVLLLKTAAVGVVSEWQVVTCGVLLIVMAIGNFINTMETLVTKSKVKAKMRSSKSKHDLNPEIDGKTL